MDTSLPRRRAQGQNVHTHAQRAGGGQRGKGVANIFVAVGQEHEPFLARLRECGGAQADRAGDVGALRADDGLNLAQIDQRIGSRFNCSVRAENQHAGEVVRLFAPWPLR